MILNIRGANGSGKTTVARSFASDAGAVVVHTLATYENDRGKKKTVEGTVYSDVCLVGSYKNKCGGMDTIPSFKIAFEAIDRATLIAKHVICEGILASTVFGSWAAFATVINRSHDAGPFAFAYLDTPAELCLRRIYERNGGKKIKEQLVHDKISAIAATRKKAIAAGFAVYDLPWALSCDAAHRILAGEGEGFRAKR